MANQPLKCHHCPNRPLRRISTPPRIGLSARPPCSSRFVPCRRLPVQCVVTYNSGPFQSQGTVWNLSCRGWRHSGDLLMRPGETLSLTVTLPNEQRIQVTEAVVRGLSSALGYPVSTSAFIADFPLPAALLSDHYIVRSASRGIVDLFLTKQVGDHASGADINGCGRWQ
jgi:hypothetical protein